MGGGHCVFNRRQYMYHVSVLKLSSDMSMSVWNESVAKTNEITVGSMFP